MLKTVVSKSIFSFSQNEGLKLSTRIFRVNKLSQPVTVFQDHPHPRFFSPSCTRLKQNQAEFENEEVMGAGEKILRVKLANTRLDAVLKAGLTISRNKIEKAFYEDRIRLNGERAKKKSQILYEGDEIDVVRGANKLNPLFIDVSRVEIVDIKESTSSNSKNDEIDEGADTDDEDSTKIPVVLKRFKNLTIQNYRVPWKGNASDDK